MDCYLEDTIWFCKDCDWSSEDEKLAKIHRKFHRVIPRYFGPYQKPICSEDFIVGKCFRCGKYFINKGDWIKHEMTIPEEPKTVGFCPSSIVDLEMLERFAYESEPIYTRRFKNAPGSPRMEESERYQFKKEREELYDERKKSVVKKRPN